MNFLTRLFGKKSGPQDVKPAEGHVDQAEDPGEKTAARVGKPEETTAHPSSITVPEQQAGKWQGPELTAADAQSRFDRIVAEIIDVLMGRTSVKTIALDTVGELSVVARFIWDGDPRRADAQALHWWAEDKLKTAPGPFELKEQDRDLWTAVVFAVRALTSETLVDRIGYMQQSLIHARKARGVGGADMLIVRLSHTLGPMGMLPE